MAQQWNDQTTPMRGGKFIPLKKKACNSNISQIVISHFVLVETTRLVNLGGEAHS